MNLIVKIIGLTILLCSLHGHAASLSLPVKIATINSAEQYETVEVSGTVVSSDLLLISAETSGIITEINVEPGDQVEPDNLLLKVTDSDLKFRLSQALSKIKTNELIVLKAERALNKNQSLHDKRVIGSDLLERYEIDYKLAQQDLQQAKILEQELKFSLEQSSVLSDKKLVVVERMVSLGQWINKGDALFRILDLEAPTTLELHLPVSLLKKFNAAKSVHLKVDSIDSFEIDKRSAKLVPLIRQDSQMVNVRVPLPVDHKNNLSLLPGSQVRLTMQLSLEKGTIAVPADSLSQSAGVFTVWKWKDNTPYPINVQLSKFMDDKAIIKAGRRLKEGDKVVVSGNDYLLPGTKVQIAEEN